MGLLLVVDYAWPQPPTTGLASTATAALWPLDKLPASRAAMYEKGTWCRVRSTYPIETTSNTVNQYYFLFSLSMIVFTESVIRRT